MAEEIHRHQVIRRHHKHRREATRKLRRQATSKLHNNREATRKLRNRATGSNRAPRNRAPRSRATGSNRALPQLALGNNPACRAFRVSHKCPGCPVSHKCPECPVKPRCLALRALCTIRMRTPKERSRAQAACSSTCRSASP